MKTPEEWAEALRSDLSDRSGFEAADDEVTWKYMRDGMAELFAAAQADALESAARVAEQANERHRSCPESCHCNDGAHVAMQIRALAGEGR